MFNISYYMLILIIINSSLSSNSKKIDVYVNCPCLQCWPLRYHYQPVPRTIRGFFFRTKPQPARISFSCASLAWSCSGRRRSTRCHVPAVFIRGIFNQHHVARVHGNAVAAVDDITGDVPPVVLRAGDFGHFREYHHRVQGQACKPDRLCAGRSVRAVSDHLARVLWQP